MAIYRGPAAGHRHDQGEAASFAAQLSPPAVPSIGGPSLEGWKTEVLSILHLKEEIPRKYEESALQYGWRPA